MKFMKSLLCSFVLISPYTLSAETNTTLKTSTTSSGEEKIDPDFVVAAEKLFGIMHFETPYTQMIDTNTAFVLKRNPKLKSIEKEIHHFYEKYTGWKQIKPELTKLYYEYYNTKELNQLSDFYQTDIGQKSLELMPLLYKESQAIGVKLLKGHVDELKMLAKKTLEAATPKKSNPMSEKVKPASKKVKQTPEK